MEKPSAFRVNWFKEIRIQDDLHTKAIDNLLLFHNPPETTSTIKGIKSINSNIVPIEGLHSISFNNNEYIHAERFEENDKTFYIVKAIGNTAVKTIYNILFAKRIEINNEALVSAINNYIIQELSLKEKGRLITDVVPVPMDGIYTLYRGPGEYMNAKKNTKKEKSSYLIDISGTYYNSKVEDILNGDANRIRVVNCSIINSQINVRLMNKPPLENIYPCQRVITDYVIEEYRVKKNKNVTILISGQPGLGKSTIAFLISQVIKKEFGVDPYLIKGFNINSEEMQYHPIIGHYNPQTQSPIVLLLDEFDIALKRASNDQNYNGQNDNASRMGASSAISANKTNMNTFLDAINDESFLITVATTNVSLDDINKDYGVYCRKGRFDKHFEMMDKDRTVVCDPTM